jgi:hypothetical protein
VKKFETTFNLTDEVDLSLMNVTAWLTKPVGYMGTVLSRHLKVLPDDDDEDPQPGPEPAPKKPGNGKPGNGKGKKDSKVSPKFLFIQW